MMLRKFGTSVFHKAVFATMEAHREYLRKRSLYGEMRRLATAQTIEFLRERAPQALYFPDRYELLSVALTKVKRSGLYIELGVKRGRTINHIAKETIETVHGFDSFVGFPPSWYEANKPRHPSHGDGSLPVVRSNVKLHKGYFNETLPPFIAQHDTRIAFLHVDCVIYESTETALSILGDRLGPGAVVVMDEYFNFWGWQHRQHRAFEEFLGRSGLVADYFGFSEQQLAAKLVSP